MSSRSIYARLRPVIFAFAPEAAHRLTLLVLRCGLSFQAALPVSDRAILRTRVWDLEFANPLGLAAGFDKDAEVADVLLRSGFGFVEIGSVTPRPQPGNPKPRIFRLAEDRALINRLGFNSAGLARVEANLRRRRAEGLTAAADAVCCIFRGSVVALDTATGKERWRRTVPAPADRKYQHRDGGVAMPTACTSWRNWKARNTEPCATRAFSTGRN